MKSTSIFLLVVAATCISGVNPETYYYDAARAVYEQCAELGVYPGVAIYPDDNNVMNYFVSYEEGYNSSNFRSKVGIPIIIVGNISAQTSWSSDLLFIAFDHDTFVISTSDCRYIYNNFSDWSFSRLEQELSNRTEYMAWGTLDL